MRRLVQLLVLGCLLVVPAVAQRGGHGGGGGFGGFHGGMGGFRGGGFGGFRGGGFGGFRGGGFGGFRGGFGRGWFGRGGWNRWGWGSGWGWGWGGFWPYYSAGWGWGYPYYGFTSYPDWGYSYPYTYSYPYVGSYSYPYTYSNPTDSTGFASRYASSAPVQVSCAQSNGTPLYLIKLTYQDKVWAARDYWYTPGTLNFITWQSELNKTPIETIDRAATFQLNSQCGVNFQFPK
jgi:hypothetical protein